MLYYTIILYYIILYYIVLYYIILYYIISYYIINVLPAIAGAARPPVTASTAPVSTAAVPILNSN